MCSEQLKKICIITLHLLTVANACFFLTLTHIHSSLITQIKILHDLAHRSDSLACLFLCSILIFLYCSFFLKPFCLTVDKRKQ